MTILNGIDRSLSMRICAYLNFHKLFFKVLQGYFGEDYIKVKLKGDCSHVKGKKNLEDSSLPQRWKKHRSLGN